jgi:hypothetical protein
MMLARTPRPHQASSIPALREGAGPNPDALTARGCVDTGMGVARLAYDDDSGAVRGSALDEESHEGGSDSNSTSAWRCGAC